MPWKAASHMDERCSFIMDHARGLWAMTELCARYGISRKTGYKWLARFAAAGPAGLADRSRRPHHSPHAVPAPIVTALLALRRRRPRWSAKKLLWDLGRREPAWPLPAVSTAQAIFKRHGLVVPRGRRKRPGPHPGRPCTLSRAANDIWTADFKGEFRLRTGPYCYPLTVLDDYSRFVLACEACRQPTVAATTTTFHRLFHQYGLPRVIRTDNGTPFASTGLARLSRLAVWWLELGITPELIQPARPDQNGRHERFHRTLKAEATRPPAATRAAQQRRFDAFCEDYNTRRPHEALGQRPPAELYHRSDRRPPSHPPTVTYPAYFEHRRVGSNGCVRWKTRSVFVSHVLAGRTIGFEERAHARWAVYLGPRYLGLFLEDQLTIVDRYDRTPPDQCHPCP